MQHMTDCHVDPVPHTADAHELEGADKVDLAIAGMGCVNCGNRIRNALLSHPGVLEVAVDVTSALARVWYLPGEVRLQEILAVIRVVGEATHHRYMGVPVGSRWRRAVQD